MSDQVDQVPARDTETGEEVALEKAQEPRRARLGRLVKVWVGGPARFLLGPFVWLWTWSTSPIRNAYLRWEGRLAERVAAFMDRERTKERARTSRLQIALTPGAWPGEDRRCDPRDGGCNFRVFFPPLKLQRRGDREIWLLICPNCRKQRVVLATNPSLRKLQTAAWDEVREHGGAFGGPAYRAYEKALVEANNVRHTIRTRHAKSGPGSPPEAREPEGPQEAPQDPQEKPEPAGA